MTRQLDLLKVEAGQKVLKQSDSQPTRIDGARLLSNKEIDRLAASYFRKMRHIYYPIAEKTGTTVYMSMPKALFKHVWKRELLYDEEGQERLMVPAQRSNEIIERCMEYVYAMHSRVHQGTLF